jgi:hypothetical protein
MTVQQLQSEINRLQSEIHKLETTITRYKLKSNNIKLQCGKIIRDNKTIFGQTTPTVKFAKDILQIVNSK